MTAERADEIGSLARAIADPTRRRILDRLASRPGSTTGELAAVAPGVTRFAVIKHLDVLRAAGLVRTMADGRRRRHYAEPAALDPLRSWLGDR
ncbi:MAG: ArsR/SmtB family transcription factor [Candidatus Limnocylindrales bacterium]